DSVEPWFKCAARPSTSSGLRWNSEPVVGREPLPSRKLRLALLQEGAGALAVVGAVHGAFDGRGDLGVPGGGRAGGESLEHQLGACQRQRRVRRELGG